MTDYSFSVFKLKYYCILRMFKIMSGLGYVLGDKDFKSRCSLFVGSKLFLLA